MRNRLTRLPILFLVFGALALFISCAPKLLPNSSLRDTWENRQIADFMGLYTKAIERRSSDAVMELVAQDYFEDGGNADPSDDYGYAELRDKLDSMFARAKELRIGIHLQKVILKDDRYEIFYFFRESGLMEFPSGAKWMTAADVNRIVARKKGSRISDGLEIVSGL